MNTTISMTDRQVIEVHDKKNCPESNPVVSAIHSGRPIRMISRVVSGPGYPIKIRTVVEKLASQRRLKKIGDKHRYLNCQLYVE